MRKKDNSKKTLSFYQQLFTLIHLDPKGKKKRKNKNSATLYLLKHLEFVQENILPDFNWKSEKGRSYAFFSFSHKRSVTSHFSRL